MSTSQTSSAEGDHTDTDESNPTGLDRTDAIIAGVVGVVVFVAYVRTIAPGLLVDDSGEFQTMARLLGHTHPTGYEVYSILGRVFSTIPIGDAATRVTAFSAFTGGIAAALVYIISRLLRSPKAIAVIPALAFAVAPTVWSQGIIAEVYAPAAAFAGVIIASLLVWQSTGRRRWLVAAGVVGGLSVGIHFSIGLYLPAIAIFLVLVALSRPESIVSAEALRRTWLPAAGGAVIGVIAAVVLFVAVDVSNPPSQYFDAVVAPSRSAWDLGPGQIDGTSERLKFDWTARQFTGLMFTSDGLAGERWEEFRASVPTEISFPLLLTALIGFGWLVWRRWRVAVVLVVAIGTQLVFAFNYDIGDMIYVFYIPTYMLLAIVAGAGLTAIVDGAEKIPGVGAAVAAAGVAVVALVFGVYPIASANTVHLVNGTTPPYEFEAYPYDDYVATTVHPMLSATIADLPENAIVFGDWEMLYPSFWVAHVEQGRTDLMFHETYPADDQEGMAASAVSYIVEQSALRPVYVPERIPELAAAGITYAPARIGPSRLFKVVP